VALPSHLYPQSDALKDRHLSDSFGLGSDPKTLPWTCGPYSGSYHVKQLRRPRIHSGSLGLIAVSTGKALHSASDIRHLDLCSSQAIEVLGSFTQKLYTLQACNLYISIISLSLLSPSRMLPCVLISLDCRCDQALSLGDTFSPPHLGFFMCICIFL
jgi:hypothetical protein